MIRIKHTKGQMRVIEAILASLIIVASISFANVLATIPTSPKYELTELEKLGYNVLHDLDKQGLLPRFVYNRQWGNLTAALGVSLPLDVYFNLTIYHLDGTRVSHPLIVYGGGETFKTSKNIASVSYGLIGLYNGTTCQADYDPRTLILQLARG